MVRVRVRVSIGIKTPGGAGTHTGHTRDRYVPGKFREFGDGHREFDARVDGATNALPILWPEPLNSRWPSYAT